MSNTCLVGPSLYSLYHRFSRFQFLPIGWYKMNQAVIREHQSCPWNLCWKRWTNETESRFYKPVSTLLIEVYLRLLQTICMSSQRLSLHISVSVRTCIPTRTHLTNNNDKPWFTAKHRQLRQNKEDAYRKGDTVLYKQAKCWCWMSNVEWYAFYIVL